MTIMHHGKPCAQSTSTPDSPPPSPFPLPSLLQPTNSNSQNPTADPLISITSLPTPTSTSTPILPTTHTSHKKPGIIIGIIIGLLLFACGAFLVWRWFRFRRPLDSTDGRSSKQPTASPSAGVDEYKSLKSQEPADLGATHSARSPDGNTDSPPPHTRTDSIPPSSITPSPHPVQGSCPPLFATPTIGLRSKDTHPPPTSKSTGDDYTEGISELNRAHHPTEVSASEHQLRVVSSLPKASYMAPPTPPRNTVNPGYNPQLDKPRPKDIGTYLLTYHVCFIVDDSISMSQGNRWDEAGTALLEIAEYALARNIDEIDLKFLNSPLFKCGVKGAAAIRAMFKQVRLSAGTPIGAALRKVLNEHINLLDRAIDTPEYHTIRPLDIILLTDGVPSDNPKSVLLKAVAHLRMSKHHPNAVGVQIVQIGNAPRAVPILRSLMGDDVGSIVDTVPYDGKLTPGRLERILLGGLHPNVRALIQY